MKRKQQREKCEARTCICSGKLLAKYSVNGSGKEGKTFTLCGPCAVYLRRGGHKVKVV